MSMTKAQIHRFRESIALALNGAARDAAKPFRDSTFGTVTVPVASAAN